LHEVVYRDSLKERRVEVNKKLLRKFNVVTVTDLIVQSVNKKRPVGKCRQVFM